jgi:uncharacterized protein (TIGR03437 family)
VQVSLESHYGPAARITLAPAAPALYQSDTKNAAATRPDGSGVTKDSPAKPGEIVVLYGTGFGPTLPPQTESTAPAIAAILARTPEFKVQLNGKTLDAGLIYYVGITPGFAGLYQVNLRLPDDTTPDPEIRVGFDGQMSPAGVQLPVH